MPRHPRTSPLRRARIKTAASSSEDVSNIHSASNLHFHHVVRTICGSAGKWTVAQAHRTLPSAVPCLAGEKTARNVGPRGQILRVLMKGRKVRFRKNVKPRPARRFTLPVALTITQAAPDQRCWDRVVGRIRRAEIVDVGVLVCRRLRVVFRSWALAAVGSDVEVWMKRAPVVWERYRGYR